MQKILLKSVMTQLSGCPMRRKDILVENNVFKKIEDSLCGEDCENAEVVDCRNFAILPAFYNGHTHAAMTLLRGYADDMELNKWLTQYIWPFEARLTDYDIAVGSRLAILEMIKSGTVFFADMYWRREQTMKAVEDMGVRATIGVTISDMLTPPDGLEKNFEFLKNHTMESERVKLAAMPHSVYTNGVETLKRTFDLARAENYKLHIHLCETKSEVENCKKQHGCSPLELVDRLGGLDERLVGAHCVYFTEKDRKLFVDAQATVVLNPCSNLKLSSGIPLIPAMISDKVKLALGTDGASSNNNLDMREEMKMAALIAKVAGSAETLPAEDSLKMATRNVALAYGINGGEIAVGKLADFLLVDMNNERMVPCHDLVSNWVYAADSCCINSVVCNGRFVMRNRHVDGEEDILNDARTCARRLASTK